MRLPCMSIVAAPRRWPWRRRARRFASHYERVLGTSLELQVVAPDERVARRVEGAALAEIDRLEAILSGWSATSELARWQGTHDVDVPVSPELAEVLDAAAAWRARTGGAFDPGAQAVVDLLRDGDAAPASPSADAVRALLDALRRPLWSVDRARGVARRLTRLPVSLDAIAKGYVVHRAAAAAHAVDGVRAVLLNVGGDVEHRGEGAVSVGVADPFAPAENAPLLAVVRLSGEALATSGGYRRSFRSGGRRVSHIVDPRSARPAERVVGASVVAPDCATADALSTAFSVLAPADSVALADALPGVGCLLVQDDGTVTTSAAWRARSDPPPSNGR